MFFYERIDKKRSKNVFSTGVTNVKHLLKKKNYSNISLIQYLNELKVFFLQPNQYFREINDFEVVFKAFLIFIFQIHLKHDYEKVCHWKQILLLIK